MTTDQRAEAVAAAESSGDGNGDPQRAVQALADATYRSSFHSWDRTSSVRSRARHSLAPIPYGRPFFSPELVPVVDHPLLTERGPHARYRVLVQALYQYLNFTTELEDVGVIPCAIELSRNRSGLVLPDQARRDAFNIVTDEAWHAQFSDDLLRQVEDWTGEKSLQHQQPMFIARLDAVRRGMDSRVQGAERMIFCIVSETLISALLADIPHDMRLPAAVRDVVADHALDEGRHHAYFRSILQAFWPSLSAADQRRIGPWLPSIILAFLEPDYLSLATTLSDVGLTVDEVETVIAESHPRSRVQSDTASAAKTSIRYFAELGALDDPATADAFAVAGLASGLA